MKTIKAKERISGTVYIGKWNNGSNVSIYDVIDANGLNAIIGLAKHRNNDNTVLYRGQCRLYEHLVPSILHDKMTYDNKLIELKNSLEKLYINKELNTYCDWDKTVNGWKLYITTTYEAALQHYGAKTRSVDFVDNHWTALWFALNEYKSGTYSKRVLSETSYEEEKWITYVDPNRLPDDGSKYGYIFLYLADTSVPEVNGLYLGKDSYTVDLRKALPPTFLRPISQHGWVVQKKEMTTAAQDNIEMLPSNYNHYIFDKDVVAILRIKIDLIDHMLGNGILLSQGNFFPNRTHDNGYNVLYNLQGSDLPLNMLEEYNSKVEENTF